MYVFVCMGGYVCMYECMCSVCVYVFVYVYACIYLYLCMYVYVCMHMYVYSKEKYAPRLPSCHINVPLLVIFSKRSLYCLISLFF